MPSLQVTACAGSHQSRPGAQHLCAARHALPARTAQHGGMDAVHENPREGWRDNDGPKPGALAGLKVLDFSIMMAGPYAARLMADLGADVVKVEPPEGD